LDENGQPMIPLGLNNDPSHVFEMQEDGALKVSGEYYGCLFSKVDYQNYRFKLKVKWGEKKWSPRQDLLKDAGLIYYSAGPHGADYWHSWMMGQEFQCMEGHFVDYCNITNTAIDV